LRYTVQADKIREEVTRKGGTFGVGNYMPCVEWKEARPCSMLKTNVRNLSGGTDVIYVPYDSRFSALTDYWKSIHPDKKHQQVRFTLRSISVVPCTSLSLSLSPMSKSACSWANGAAQILPWLVF